MGSDCPRSPRINAEQVDDLRHGWLSTPQSFHLAEWPRDKSWPSVRQFIQLLPFIALPFVPFLQLRRSEKRLSGQGSTGECSAVQRHPRVHPRPACPINKGRPALRCSAIRATPSVRVVLEVDPVAVFWGCFADVNNCTLLLGHRNGAGHTKTAVIALFA